jgi:SAM-dependent methyltransferase
MGFSFLEGALVLASLPQLRGGSEILMLGRQSNLLSAADLEVLGQRYGCHLAGLDRAKEAWVEPFFQRLGLVPTSLDCSDYEGATLIHDMNRSWAGGAPPRQFDLVLDGGSLEHMFNLPQAVVNAMQLVKPGGLLLSVTPADGWLGHGFYQLQPEIGFRMFTSERGFSLRGCWLAEFGRRPAGTRFFRLKDPATTGLRHRVPGRRPLSLLLAARKEREVDLHAVPWPTQSNYTAAWLAGGTTRGTGPGGPSLKRRLACLLPGTLRVWLEERLSERRHSRQARAGWRQEDRLMLD